MTVQQLIEYLSTVPPEREIKIWIDHSDRNTIVPLNEEHFHHTSEGAYIDDSADPDTWDAEDGKIRNKGKRYIMLNPIIN